VEIEETAIATLWIRTRTGTQGAEVRAICSPLREVRRFESCRGTEPNKRVRHGAASGIAKL